MISSAIVSRYAGALADVVTGPSAGVAPAEAVQELRSFEAALNSSPELRNALSSPAVPPARKRAVIRGIAERLELSRIVCNFLLLLSDHRRAAGLPEIIETLEVLLDERLGFVRAEVRSAQAMEERRRAALADELSRLTGKKVRMRFAVDAGLIGGMVARIGSTVYDGSVRGQLEALGRRLAAE